MSSETKWIGDEFAEGEVAISQYGTEVEVLGWSTDYDGWWYVKLPNGCFHYTRLISKKPADIIEPEILNIEHHVKDMIIKALNCTKKHTEAAEKLGICVRSLYRHMKNFNIEKDHFGRYYIKPTQSKNGSKS